MLASIRWRDEQPPQTAERWDDRPDQSRTRGRSDRDRCRSDDQSGVGDSNREWDIDSSTEVTGIEERFPSRKTIAALKEADVVVACLDRFDAREASNAFCRRHLIPLVDAGMAIRSAGEQLATADGQVILSLPEHPCLRCFFITDAVLERERLERPPGYDQNPDAQGDPQVVSMNGVLASEACNCVLDLIAGYSGGRRGARQWHTKDAAANLSRLSFHQQDRAARRVPRKVTEIRAKRAPDTVGTSIGYFGTCRHRPGEPELLGGKGESVVERALERHRRVREIALDKGDRVAIVEQLVQRLLAEIEEAPPRRLALAPVIEQQVRQQPSLGLVGVVVVTLGRQRHGQRLDEGKDRGYPLGRSVLLLGLRRR